MLQIPQEVPVCTLLLANEQIVEKCMRKITSDAYWHRFKKPARTS